MTMRVENHPVLGDQKERKPVTIYFDGKPHRVYEGDTIASAMMAEGIYTLRHHETSGKGRGIYCNIGHCFECRVKLEGRKVVRACMTPVFNGMEIHSLTAIGERDE